MRNKMWSYLASDVSVAHLMWATYLQSLQWYTHCLNRKTPLQASQVYSKFKRETKRKGEGVMRVTRRGKLFRHPLQIQRIYSNPYTNSSYPPREILGSEWTDVRGRNEKSSPAPPPIRHLSISFFLFLFLSLYR